MAIGLAAGLDLAWGFLADYPTLINAVVHLLAGIVRRESNGGLVTAVPPPFSPLVRASCPSAARLFGRSPASPR